MSGFVNRENQIFDILQVFTDAELDFVVVGGYAVSGPLLDERWRELVRTGGE